MNKNKTKQLKRDFFDSFVWFGYGKYQKEFANEKNLPEKVWNWILTNCIEPKKDE